MSIRQQHSSVRIEALREELGAQPSAVTPLRDLNRADYIATDAGTHLFYFGSFYDEPFEALVRAVSADEVANDLLTLTIDGPDDGANGTRNLDLSQFTEGAVQFPKLRHFEVARSRPEFHNQTVIAETYHEDGQIGRLVGKSPNLKTLIVPSAPAANFFECNLGTLRTLDVDAGYDAQNFINALADCSTLSNLEVLAWGEYSQTDTEDWKAEVTPLQTMMRLLQSPAFAHLSLFVLRNPTYTENELAKLGAIRPNLTFQTVRESSRYIYAG